MNDTELKRLRERCFKAREPCCPFTANNPQFHLARVLPAVLDEVELLRKYIAGTARHDADISANAERFRSRMYELENLVCRRRTERDEARAEEKRLLLENAAVLDEIERYRRVFRHTHQALYEGDKLLRACARCGLDLVDEVHERLESAARGTP